MKKLLFLLLFIPAFAVAQSNQTQWQSNYWKTRTNFTNYFCVIGKDPGMSIPFNRNPLPQRDCDNPEYGPNQKTYIGSLHAGDATIMLGQYIAALALEYQLLKDNGKDVSRTLTELYFAVLAVGRLDNYAEFFNSDRQFQWDPVNNNSVLNGYLVRDDFRWNFWDMYDGQAQNYFRDEIKRGDLWQEDALQMKRYIATDNNMPCGTGAQANTANVFNPNNQISKDQLAGLFVGFALIRKLNINVDYSPGTGHSSINFLTKTVEYTRRIMDHWTALKIYADDGDERFSMNYFFKNPVTNKMAQYGGQPAGSTDFAMGYLFGKVANYITSSSDYSVPWILKREKKILGEWTQVNMEIVRFDNTFDPNDNKAGFSNPIGHFWPYNLKDAFEKMDPDNQSWLYEVFDGEDHPLLAEIGNFGFEWNSYSPNYISFGGLTWFEYFHNVNKRSLEDLFVERMWDNANVFTSDKANKKVVRRLVLMLGSLLPDHRLERDKFHEYCVISNNNFYSLIYDLMNDDGNPYYSVYENQFLYNGTTQLKFTGSSLEFWQNLLDSFPCSGPLYFPIDQNAALFDDGYWPECPSWSGLNIMINNPPREHTNAPRDGRGWFSGVDYMLFYNLYHYRFKSNIQDGYDPTTGCNCATLDDPIQEWGALTTDYTIKRKQNGDPWENFGYELYEYTSGNKTFGSYDLNVHSGLILCKGLFTFSSGLVNVGSATEVGNFVIQNQGTLDLSNTVLNVYGGSTLTVKTGGTLVLNAGANLLVHGLGKVIIEPGGALVIKGGITTFTGGSGELIIRGGLSLESPTAYTWNPTGTGNVIFGGQCYVIGSLTQMSIKFDQPGVKFWVEDDAFVEFPPYLEMVEFLGSTLYLGKDAYLSFLSKTDVSNCNVTRWPSETAHFTYLGLVFWGAEGMDPRDNRPMVYGTTFSHGKYGVQSFQKFGLQKSIIVSGCFFMDMQTAISIEHGGGYIFGNTFQKSNQQIHFGNKGISSKHTSNFLCVESNLFENIGYGVETSSSHGYKAIVAGNVFDNTIEGVIAQNGALGLKCNYFDNNFYSVQGTGRNYLNATRDMNMLQLLANPIYGGDNAIDIPTDNNMGLAYGGATLMHIKNGQNFFDKYSGYSMLIWNTQINRSINIGNRYLPLDIDFSQNIWGNYVPPTDPSFLFISTFSAMNPDHPVHMDIEGFFPINAIGSRSTSTLSCQVPNWSSALNPSTFVPGSQNGMLFKKQPLSGILDPYGTFGGGGYSSGPLMGQSYQSALNGVYTGVSEVDYDRYTISDESFTQFGVVLSNSFQLDMDFDVTTVALSDYLNFGNQLLENKKDNPTAQLLVFNEIHAVLLEERAWLNTSNTSNVLFYNEMMTQNEINMAYLYRAVEDYPNALFHLNSAKLYGIEWQDIWIESIECYFQIERDLIENTLERNQFLKANDFCTSVKNYSDSLRTLSRTFPTGFGEEHGGESGPIITVSIAPNPVTGEDLQFMLFNTSEMNQTVNITIYDKFGIQKGTMSVVQVPGSTTYTMPLPGLVNDVYTLISEHNFIPSPVLFILNR